MKKALLLSSLCIPTIVGCTSNKTEEVKTSDDKRPNVILFVADDHGMDALGCYGNTVIKTPNLDSLRDSGIKFTEAHCTSASSAASRAALLTGKFSHAIGAYGHTHDYHHFSTYDSVSSLPMILADNGYTTARIGKYHLAPEKVYHFDTTYKANPRSTLEMADKCKGIFASEKPFFLYFCTDDPHRHQSTDPSRWDAPNSFGNKVEPYPMEIQMKYNPEDVLVPSFLPDTKQTREEIAQYYQSISRIDQGFGRLMAHLRESGKDKNTIVIYISDNGMAFPGAKTTTYEPGLKLPCLISLPEGKNAGKECDEPITWVDMTPTICDFAGIDTKQYRMQGESFASVVENPESSLNRPQIFASHTFHEITMYYPMRVCNKGGMKLIWNVAWQLPYPFASDLWQSSTWQSIHRGNVKTYGKRTTDAFLHRPEFELYDLNSDPDEIHNLANNPKYKATLQNMIEELKAWQVKTNDPWYIMWSGDSMMQGSGVNL